MDNEIEQLAEQHGMTIEFVTWFFNEKKAGCGNVWFMMLAAMWEGWKGRSIEMDKLAAENVGLTSAAEFATAPDMWIEQADGMLDYRYCDWYVDVLKAAMETPATNAVLTELRNEAGARAVELFAKTLGSPYTFRDEKCYEDGFTRAIEVVRDTQAPRFAKQLREVSK